MLRVMLRRSRVYPTFEGTLVFIEIEEQLR
jgi:hypothetical protein